MPYKDPNNFSYLTAFIMLVLALWGGAVNYIARVKKGAVEKFSLIELVGEFCISGFSGIVVYLIGANYEVRPLLLAAMVAVAGHAGGRTVFLLESVFHGKLESLTKQLKGNSNDR